MTFVVHVPCRHCWPPTALSKDQFDIFSFCTCTWMPSIITYCGQVVTYNDIDMGQNWLRVWCGAFRRQALNGTDVDLKMLCGLLCPRNLINVIYPPELCSRVIYTSWTICFTGYITVAFHTRRGIPNRHQRGCLFNILVRLRTKKAKLLIISTW